MQVKFSVAVTAVGFLICDGKKRVDVESVVQEKDDAKRCWILSELVFAPAEKKTLTITYSQPWSLHWRDETQREEERFSYILTPAASWAGKIDSAVIMLSMPAARPSGDVNVSTLSVSVCDLALSIEPAAAKKKKDGLVLVWKFKNHEPRSELHVSFSRGQCRDGPHQMTKGGEPSSP